MAGESEKGRDICERTFAFAARIVRVCQVLDGKPGVSRTLSNQLIRSGTSIGANVEEAQGGQSRKDFLAKICIARKEARETHYWLRLVAEAGLIGNERLTDITREPHELVAILTTIIKKTNTKKGESIS